MAPFLQLPLHQFSKFNNFLCVCWFFCKNLSDCVPPAWKLDNPYYHNDAQEPFGLCCFDGCQNSCFNKLNITTTTTTVSTTKLSTTTLSTTTLSTTTVSSESFLLKCLYPVPLVIDFSRICPSHDFTNSKSWILKFTDFLTSQNESYLCFCCWFCLWFCQYNLVGIKCW